MLDKEQKSIKGTLLFAIFSIIFIYLSKLSMDYSELIDDFFGGFNRSAIVGIPAMLFSLISVSMLIVYISKIIDIVCCKNNMKKFELQNLSYSKLYYQGLPGYRLKSIHMVVETIDGNKVKKIKGFDKYGDFLYMSDKNDINNDDITLIPTFIKISENFFKKELLDHGTIEEMDFIFFYPKEKYLMFFNEERFTFTIVHQWNGDKVDIEDYKRFIKNME